MNLVITNVIIKAHFFKKQKQVMTDIKNQIKLWQLALRLKLLMIFVQILHNPRLMSREWVIVIG